jgi:hypothetical protein
MPAGVEEALKGVYLGNQLVPVPTLSRPGFSGGSKVTLGSVVGAGCAGNRFIEPGRWDRSHCAGVGVETKSMYCAVAVSRSSIYFPGPLLRTSSAFNRELNASCRALSYESPVELIEATVPTSARR